jgi:histidyl-tRNA synthetase
MTQFSRTPKKAEAERPPEKPSGKSIQTVRGFKDILPADQPTWRWLERTAESFAAGYGFGRIDLPILEHQNLFVRAIGKQTDIVDKELFAFTDQGEDALALRPEATAGICRAYINHGMLSLPQPVKFWYWGPMFRRERPQSGRQRQFYQFGLEVLGDANPVIDAQLILIGRNFFRDLGLDQVSVQVNSIGCPDCRKQYKNELVNYYRAKRRLLCEDCKKRLVKNPLRLLDCKTPSCQPLKAEAPQIVDWLDDACKQHFMRVINYLDELDVSYVLNPYLVRGLDYYNRTVFEFWPSAEETGSQGALGGGGRYDPLIEMLGGRPTPAAGWSLGVERIFHELRVREIALPLPPSPQIFLAQIGDQAKIKALGLFEQLRQEKIPVAESFAKDSLKAQLELANKANVKYALILGQKEVLEGTILIREMDGGVQETVNFTKVVSVLKKKLQASGDLPS